MYQALERGREAWKQDGSCEVGTQGKMMGQQRTEGLVTVWAKSYLELRVPWHGSHSCLALQLSQESSRYRTLVPLMRVDINRRICSIEYVYRSISCHGNKLSGIRDTGFPCQMERFIWRGIYCFYASYVGAGGQ